MMVKLHEKALRFSIIVIICVFSVSLHSYDKPESTASNKTAAELFPLEQFKKMLGLQVPDELEYLRYIDSNPLDSGIVLSEEYPEWFDLRPQRAVTSVKNQGACGGCWAFSSIAVFESLIRQSSGKIVNLSEQHLINCVPDNNCNGGFPIQALKFMKNSGVVIESSYPYQAADGVCDIRKPSDYYLTKYYSAQIRGKVLEERVKTIKYVLTKYGMVIVGFDLYSDFYYHYSKGVYYYDGYSAKVGAHSVTILGWQDDDSYETGGYWICKNSWGREWGENGYFRIGYDQARIDNWILEYAEWYEINNPPKFTAMVGSLSVREGEAISFTAEAEDDDGDELIFTFNSVPENAKYDEEIGYFVWTPDYKQAGIYHVEVIVSDGKSYVSQLVKIEVLNVKRINY